jgi:hypothetical protein
LSLADGGRGDAGRARILLSQSRLRLAQARPDEAAEAARAAMRLFELNTLDAGQSADVGEAMLALALAQLALDDRTAARQTLKRASLSLRNGLGAEHRLTLLARTLSSDAPQP